jgi:hypothetical protein
MTRRVNVGEEFEGEVQVRESKVRRTLVYLVTATGMIFLFGAAILGLRTGQFGPLQTVWAAVAPIYGGIAGSYLGNSQNQKSKKK